MNVPDQSVSAYSERMDATFWLRMNLYVRRCYPGRPTHSNVLVTVETLSRKGRGSVEQFATVNSLTSGSL